MGLSLPESFNYATHAVTLLVYAVFFRKKWIPLIVHPLRVRTQIMTAVLYGIAALVPTCAAYFLLMSVPIQFPLWLGFSVTTLILFWPQSHLYSRLSMGKACIIGCVQGIALLPGISRLGITYVTARLCGVHPRTAFYFSCMIEAPLIAVASLKGLYDIRAEISLTLIVVSMIAGVITYGALWCAYVMAQKNRWWLFGIYTAILAISALVTLRSF